MTKLRYLRAEAFRGARFELPIDFTKDSRSIAIFGENAAGKSTITDALEWFIHDRVAHLWREDCKEEALRHVLAEDGDASVVELRFDGEDRKGNKSLSAGLKTTTTFAHESVGELVKSLKGDGIILRHADIVRFLDESKGKKREAIAGIIGYEEITLFRSVIQQTRNSLQKEPAYTAARQQLDNLQSLMVESVGQVVPDKESFLAIAGKIVEPFELEGSISDGETYEQVLEELRKLSGGVEKIRAVERLGQIITACEDLNIEINSLSKNAEAFSENYNALVKERESVNKLRLSDFLAKGKEVIDDEIVTVDQCPFCQTDFVLSDLRAEVEKRLMEMAELQVQLEETEVLKDSLLSAVTNTGQKSKALSQNFTDLADYSTLLGSATKTTENLRTYFSAVDAAFKGIEIFEAPEGFYASLEEFRKKCESSIVEAKQAAKKLELTDIETQVASAVTKLQSLKEQVSAYVEYRSTLGAYEAQILTLSAMFDEFVAVQNSALQAVLDTISEDVGEFYSKLHPNESVDEVRLSMVGEEGVEFEYSFHGKPTQPPRKYLSESHLNSLGVVLFLANARIFNKSAKFLILDDIVTSFDTSHRRRLLRLLRDEFSDWQIIILTHESVWFDLIKREMAQSSWLFREVRADDENGILLDESPSTLRAIIEKKKGKEDVTNDLRKLLEAVLKEICFALEATVVFRFNEANEKRMPDELLSRLRSTLKIKSPELATNDVFANLAGSTLIANLDSHDNTEKIVGADIDVLLEDIEKLASLFHCAECNRPIRAKVKIPGANEISCKCGQRRIPWKS